MLLTCTVCAGSGRVPVVPELERHKRYISGYDPVTDTFGCTNCGAQYQWGRTTGLVKPNKQGKACVHEYTHRNIGRCLHEHVCRHCGDYYQIDSGD
jgi:hypothetical protein